jgi:hypothetical protein
VALALATGPLQTLIVGALKRGDRAPDAIIPVAGIMSEETSRS